jgi:hypothetical protein
MDREFYQLHFDIWVMVANSGYRLTFRVKETTTETFLDKIDQK